MSEMAWYSASQLADLPGMPATKAGVIHRASMESWDKRPRSGRGGGWEYPSTALPLETNMALLGMLQPEAAQPAKSSTVVRLPVRIEDTNAREREGARARMLVVEHIKRLCDTTRCSKEAAMTTLITSARAGKIDSCVDAALKAARDPRGRKGDGYPSIRSLKRYLGSDDLTPRRTRHKDMSVKPWHAVAVQLKQRPQGASMAWIAEKLEEDWNEEWGPAPKDIYSMITRFFREKFSQLDALKGRYTGSQLRAHKFYQHRTSDGVLPWDEVHADGWNTHFTAPHPRTGEYVTYEVWHAHDVATRYVPPFGVGLTENFEVIAKCVENAVRAGGVMRFLQTDSTRIVKNSEMFKTNPATALGDRAGITIVHPQEVGNSQANGIAENFNTWLDRDARELATYQHPSRMDELSFKRGKKLTAAMVKAANAGDAAELQAKKRELELTNKGIVLTSYESATEWLEKKRQKWNHKPHSSLKKVRDPDTGRARHQTPFEALMEHIDDGWEPSLPDVSAELLELHLVDLFRPHTQVKVTRGTVSPYGGMRYRNEELDNWLGKQVVVAYDIMDWRQVWVKTLEGEPICTAKFVEATGYRTLSAIESAEEKRLKARIRNRERAIARDIARNPGAVIEADAPKELTILDFIDTTATRIETEPEKTLLDFLPDPTDKEKESTYADTVMWLYGGQENKKEEEVAAR